jgi:cobalt-zinc-cadmium efflux system outer membrane protein
MLVAAAEATLTAADYGRRVQRRSVWTLPSIEGGVEFGEPGIDRGLLPTVGLALPLPFLNRNQGPILAADAERERAQAELELARLESRVLITRSIREREVAFGKLERDRVLLESANRVVTMSIQAYQEGAAPLATVLEAQRTAREVLGQYIDDMAAAWIAVSAVRLYTLTPSQP